MCLWGNETLQFLYGLRTVDTSTFFCRCCRRNRSWYNFSCCSVSVSHQREILSAANSLVSWLVPTKPVLWLRLYTPYGEILPSSLSGKSWYFSPLLVWTVFLTVILPMFSRFFVSTEITGSPAIFRSTLVDVTVRFCRGATRLLAAFFDCFVCCNPLLLLSRRLWHGLLLFLASPVPSRFFANFLKTAPVPGRHTFYRLSVFVFSPLYPGIHNRVRHHCAGHDHHLLFHLFYSALYCGAGYASNGFRYSTSTIGYCLACKIQPSLLFIQLR